MFRGKDIDDLIALFKRRDISLYHACQFMDWRSYLELGGIPSRALMEKRGVEFTRFDTDATDRLNDVWGKVFLNLSDFGVIFERGWGGTPNFRSIVVFA